MEKALFVGTSGAKETMRNLEVLTNNLANVNTVGFRGDYEAMKQSKDDGKVQRTRVYSTLDKTYSDFTFGPTIKTDRDLDVSISGSGFFAVQGKDGREGYTRAGDLQRTPDGLITTRTGELVLGTAGVVSTPRDVRRINIAEDGSISVLMKGQDLPVTVNRLKLVNPKVDQLQKGADGLFYPVNNEAARADDKVRVIPGTLEGSNVNPVQALTSLIEISRQFEMHTTFMKTLEGEEAKSNQVLELPR